MIEIGHVGTMDGVIGCKGNDEREDMYYCASTIAA